MEESTKKALEMNLKRAEIEKKIMSYFESVSSEEEECKAKEEALDWLCDEWIDDPSDAIDYINGVLDKNHYQSHIKGGCVITILIAMTSTLSLCFIL